MKERKIAMGAWSWGVGAIGGDQVFGNYLNEKDLKPVFDEAMKAGFNIWDTAAVYGMGASELILGEFIKDINREDIIISTKFTPQIADNSGNAAQNMINGSKERLNTDIIDIYWIHNPLNSEKWTPELIPLAKSGQIKSIGVSNHNLSELKRANEIFKEAGLKISAVQNHYSLIHRSSERAGIIDYCNENDITFYSYMVMEQGALTGRYNSENLFPEGTGRATSYNQYLPKLQPLLDEMIVIAKAYNASVAQIAIAWALAKGTVPIIGVTKVKHVEEAVGAAKIELSLGEIKRLEDTAEKLEVSALREWEKEMV